MRRPTEKNPYKMTIRKLRRTLKSSVNSMVRVGLQTARYAAILNEHTTVPGQELKAVSHISILDTGGQISGSGQIYEHFQKTDRIENYSGYGQKPVSFYDPGFKTAVLREMNFDKSYHGMQYDCWRSGTFDPTKDVLLRKEDSGDSNDDESDNADGNDDAVPFEVENVKPAQKMVQGKARKSKITTGKSHKSETTNMKGRKPEKPSVSATLSPWNKKIPRNVSNSWTVVKKQGDDMSVLNDQSSRQQSSATVQKPLSTKDRQLVKRARATITTTAPKNYGCDNDIASVPVKRIRTSGFVNISGPQSSRKFNQSENLPDAQSYGRDVSGENPNVLMNMPMCDTRISIPRTPIHSENGFYDGEYESYKTRCVPQVLNTTLDQLHDTLALNNHDTLFHLC